MSREIAVTRQQFLFDGSRERLEVGGVLVRAGRERQSVVIGPYQLLKEAFCRGNITLRAEHKLDGLSVGVNRPVEILPFCAGLHIRLIEAIRGPAHFQIRAHPLVDFWRVTLYPTSRRSYGPRSSRARASSPPSRAKRVDTCNTI